MHSSGVIRTVQFCHFPALPYRTRYHSLLTIHFWLLQGSAMNWKLNCFPEHSYCSCSGLLYEDVNTNSYRCTICIPQVIDELVSITKETTYLCQGECGLDPESEIRFWTVDPDDFQTLMGVGWQASLFKVTFVVKFSWRSIQYVQRYEPNCVKNALSRSVEEC